MTILLWVILVVAVVSAIGDVAQAIEPRIRPLHGALFSAVANIALAFVLIWAIAKGW